MSSNYKFAMHSIKEYGTINDTEELIAPRLSDTEIDDVERALQRRLQDVSGAGADALHHFAITRPDEFFDIFGGADFFL